MTKRKRKIIIFCSSIILLLGIGGIAYFTLTYQLDASEIYIKEIDVSSMNVLVKTQVMSSYSQLLNYSTKYEDGNLYIKIRGSTYLWFLRIGGLMDISINDDFSNLENIYLEGLEPEDNKLIWNIDKGAIKE